MTLEIGSQWSRRVEWSRCDFLYYLVPCFWPLQCTADEVYGLVPFLLDERCANSVVRYQQVQQ